MKQKQFKTKEERLQIVMNIISQLKELDLTGFEGVRKMIDVMKEYVSLDTSIQTGGFSGKIKIPELQREINYNLPILKHSNPTFVLKHKVNC